MLLTKLQQLRSVANLYYDGPDGSNCNISIELGVANAKHIVKSDIEPTVEPELRWFIRRGYTNHNQFGTGLNKLFDDLCEEECYSVWSIIYTAKNAEAVYYSIESVEDCVDVLIDYFTNELKTRAKKHQDALHEALKFKSSMLNG